jgi:hypothetical protein
MIQNAAVAAEAGRGRPADYLVRTASPPRDAARRS